MTIETKAKASRYLLNYLVCPVTKGPLHYEAEAQYLISPQINKAYPIRSGVPILVPDEAVDWPQDRDNRAQDAR
ncbi:MAG: Trm112 family protein [Candidatus Puniceispirillaceae bacterium]